MKKTATPIPKNWHEINILALKYQLGHDIRIGDGMDREEILNQIKQAEKYINKLEELMNSISVDVEYLQHEIDLGDIKDCLLSVAKSDDWDIECPHDISYSEDLEKRKILFSGVKGGYSSAIFWMADYFGLVKFFEDEIGHSFENLK